MQPTHSQLLWLSIYQKLVISDLWNLKIGWKPFCKPYIFCLVLSGDRIIPCVGNEVYLLCQAWLQASQEGWKFSFKGFSRVSPVYINSSSTHYVHTWENFHGCHQYCCGCKMADCPNIFRSINRFFWHIYSLNTELKEEGMNKIAKCYKRLYVKEVVKQWLREAEPLIPLFSDWIFMFSLSSSAGVCMYTYVQLFKSD